MGEAFSAWRRESCILWKWLTIVCARHCKGAIRRNAMAVGRQAQFTYFITCPSFSRMLLISDRNSGSWVVGVYVPAAFGTRTGVVGSDIAPDIIL